MLDDRPRIADAVGALMPQLKADLARLVAIPSISAPGFPEPRGPILEAYELTAALLRDAGVQNVRALELPDTAPAVTGELPGPPGAPTVLLYSHYDVVPAGDESLWSSPPFVATERDGAIVGRGTADSKANILVHVGALRAWGGSPPVTVKVLIEGQEEVGSPLEDPEVVAQHPDVFGADAIIVADAGSIRAGQPSLTVSLRGDARITVAVRTLAGDKHSGQYGGAAPDALLVLLRALASLHDEHGDVAVAGLRRDEWSGETYTDAEFRRLAEILDGLPIVGTGSIGSRIWTGAAITVLGIDAPAVDGAAAAVQSSARAVLNVRVHPEQDAREAQAAVVRHLERQRPFGVPLEVTAGATGDGFRATSTGPAWDAMKRALEHAWGAPPVEIATGGAIPIVKAMSDGVPGATLFVLGACDSFANIHGPDERLLVDEWEKAVLAEALFFQEYAR